MNITTNNVEVSTPFFHENNTTMNSYEAPLQSSLAQSRPEGTAGLVETASLVEPVANAATDKTCIPCSPCETAGPQSNPEQSSLAQSRPEGTAGLVETASLGENTIFHMFQVSISHSAHRKQHNEECPFQVGFSHPDCKTISDNIAREHEKMEKGREIAMQFFKPIRLVEDTNPVPWRWENRTAVPVEERGKCLLYRPVTYKMIQPTPFCLLHENDVVDNGTVMCLKARWDECVYGNETMKAMLEIDRFYRSEIKFPEIKFPEFPAIPASVVWFLILFFVVVGALQRSA